MSKNSDPNWREECLYARRADMSEKYYEALHKCAERYRDMLSEGIDNDLWDFVHELMFDCRDKLPLMKLNRWLGYIQGCLIERDYTTVEIERNWTRPLFKPLDFP
jgi:hypothetical protein